MFTNPSRELFTSETESERIVACVRRSSSVVILFESAIDRAGQVSKNAAVRTRGVRGGPFHGFQSERGLSVAANLDKENIFTVSILTLVSIREPSLYFVWFGSHSTGMRKRRRRKGGGNNSQQRRGTDGRGWKTRASSLEQGDVVGRKGIVA